ncbi:hypothetical protein SAMN05660649_02453 [Desulfotomaculum arcticum]|uniref:Uncharacterized protein n=1 Tax=Desulfotruncus arcticus DSM 17038 TaxID=1121424 RepID=A0A1I2U860_9FIRM|nr:hypothetical protein [Desulfotruncus arcticus]SFG71006.1 hypothetical protein SAMN05660649_02453 [Desulfotomaculum arcticum] [Desulfotruncus arcticus DSM 17038]
MLFCALVSYGRDCPTNQQPANLACGQYSDGQWHDKDKDDLKLDGSSGGTPATPTYNAVVFSGIGSAETAK